MSTLTSRAMLWHLKHNIEPRAILNRVEEFSSRLWRGGKQCAGVLSRLLLLWCAETAECGPDCCGPVAHVKEQPGRSRDTPMEYNRSPAVVRRAHTINTKCSLQVLLLADRTAKQRRCAYLSLPLNFRRIFREAGHLGLDCSDAVFERVQVGNGDIRSGVPRKRTRWESA